MPEDDSTEDDGKAPTAAQVRGAIDAGRGADKIAVLDPAAAPMETDSEAAGTPPGPRERIEALAQEGAQPQQRNRDTPSTPLRADRGGFYTWQLLAAALALVGLMAALVAAASA